jgi:hypothetical protein
MSSIDLSRLVRRKSCTVPCYIFNNRFKVSSFVLADTGANALALIDTRSAQATSQFLSVPIEHLPYPIVIQGFNRANAPPITSFLQLHVCVDRQRLYNISFLVTDLGSYNIILGRKWISYLGVSLDVCRRRIVWPDTLPPTPWFAKEVSILIKDLFHRPRNPRYQEDIVRRDRNSTIGKIVILELLQTKVQILQRPKAPVQPSQADCSQLTKVYKRCLEKRTELLDCKNSLRKIEQQFRSFTDLENSEKVRKPWRPSERYPANLPKVDICVIGTVGFQRNLTRPGATAFVTSLYEIDQILEERTVQEIQEDQDYQAQVDSKLPSQYREFADVFSKEAADKLPPYRLYDYKIKLEDSPDTLGFCLLHRQSTEELLATKKYIIEHLSKSFIESSQALFAAPILFVQKPNRALQFCIDFRKLNSLTWKDRYPLPFIDETLAQLGKARVFTKLDIQQAFYRIYIDPVSEDLTTFRTRYSCYKYRVVPFGLTNSPATYQQYMNNVLFDYLDNFCTAYLDNILIYSSDELEHQEHVYKVLTRLREAGL